MSYASMRDCANDLERHGHLVRIKTPIDPNLEMAEIHRRVFDAGGPALLFEQIKGSPFQGISNIYGTFERTDFLFRHTIKALQRVIELKADPGNFFKAPLNYLGAPFTALKALPRKARFRAPILYGTTTIDQLPQVVSWPMDGGGFVTLPQVLTLPPGSSNLMHANVGMYRIQMTGNDYRTNEEIGLHYQLHRGIGVHHTAYNNSDEPFRASVFIGGPPSHAFAAIMPMPEGLSELTFAGMLGGRRFSWVRKNGHILSGDADFVITGIVQKGVKKPEGPFGDHLGYYSLQHDFPVMKVEQVYYRKDPLWHFTVVGRPPQEDSSFGYLIHQLVKELTPQEFPGIKEINAVDAAGVHPLLLAVGSERYMPFRDKKPEEILAQANRILGSGQTSLAKFLIITAADPGEKVSAKDIPGFFKFVLERIDWRRDLHFHTNTTIDTLDYSGDNWNAGSKVVMAACDHPRRTLSTQLPDKFHLPGGFSEAQFVLPGILIIKAPPFTGEESYQQVSSFCREIAHLDWEGIPLIILADDSRFSAATLNNFLWTAFTRANPARDIQGVKSFHEFKHWGCEGPLVIDARIKPHHAPVLETDPMVKAKVDKLFARGGELYGII